MKCVSCIDQSHAPLVPKTTTASIGVIALALVVLAILAHQQLLPNHVTLPIFMAGGSALAILATVNLCLPAAKATTTKKTIPRLDGKRTLTNQWMLARGSHSMTLTRKLDEQFKDLFSEREGKSPLAMDEDAVLKLLAADD